MPPAPSPDRAVCPACGQPADPRHRPFCSQGCKDRDLIAWLSDAYRIPGRAVEEDEQESAHSGLDS